MLFWAKDRKLAQMKGDRRQQNKSQSSKNKEQINHNKQIITNKQRAMTKSLKPKPYDLEERTFQYFIKEATELKKILSSIIEKSK